MGAILNNHDAEALILDVRAGRRAAGTVLDGDGGHFIVFPTVVVIDRPGRGQLVFPIRTTIEPGSLCRHDGQVTVAAVVDEVDVEGEFFWTVTDRPGQSAAPSATYRFLAKGRPVATPPWAHQLPRSITVPARTAAQLLRDRERLVRQGHLAEHWLLVLSQRVMESCCRGPLRRVLMTHRLIQEEDLVQRGLQVAGRLLGIYASPNRPPRSWVGMIQLDAKRDMHREVSQLDWLPRQLSEVVDRARASGIVLDSDPTLTLAALIDASLEAGQPLPAASCRQIAAALGAPEVVSLDAQRESLYGWPPHGDGIGALDPALDAVEEARGEAAALIARIVADDETTAAQAFLGDPEAIKAVAGSLIASLRQPGETLDATRRRCHDQFRATGQLLSTDAGTRLFAHLGVGDLIAADCALRASVGLDVAGRGIEGDKEAKQPGDDHDVSD